jgi:hypothetical protein
MRAINIPSGVVAVIFAIGVLVPISVATRSDKTCTLCRAERVDRTFLGFSWQTYRDNEFTEWYRTHRPTHEHEWGRLTCTRGFSIFGRTTFFACGPRHPVCDIPPETLRQFAESADTNTLAAFFGGITSTNRDSQRQALELAWEKILESK